MHNLKQVDTQNTKLVSVLGCLKATKGCGYQVCLRDTGRNNKGKAFPLLVSEFSDTLGSDPQ